MRERVKKILEKTMPSIDFESSNKLYDDGIIDSLTLLTIVSVLGNEFGIEIDFEDLDASNFNSIDSITALVEKHCKKNQ